MRRKTLLLLTFAALAAPASAAPLMPAETPLAKACQTDFTRLCNGTSMVGVGGAGCLRQNYISLSMRCRAVLKAMRPAAPRDPPP
jgi:hypothetical protein